MWLLFCLKFLNLKYINILHIVKCIIIIKKKKNTQTICSKIANFIMHTRLHKSLSDRTRLRDLNWMENNGYGKNTKKIKFTTSLVKIKISRSHTGML